MKYVIGTQTPSGKYVEMRMEVLYRKIKKGRIIDTTRKKKKKKKVSESGPISQLSHRAQYWIPYTNLVVPYIACLG